MNIRHALHWLLRVGLAAVWLYAGALKAIHPGRLQIDIERYRLVSAEVAWLAAAYLPGLKIILGLALLLWRRSPAPALLSAGLMAVFTLALASAWVRGLDLNCGCFGGGSSGPPTYALWVLRDCALIAASVLTLRDRPARENSAVPSTPQVQNNGAEIPSEN